MIELVLALALGQWQTQGIRVNDEGVVKGYATQVNCTGAGVTCSSNGTVWTLDAAAGGGGGAPTTAQYWVGAADAGLSAEKDLSALATGLVLNTAGTPSAYAGATCTAPNFVRVLSASGAATCAAPTLALSSISNPTGDTTFTFPSGNKILWEFSGATDYAFSIHGTGAFTGAGDLVHLHLQGTPGVVAGADALHIEWEDTDATGLRLNGPAGSYAARLETTTRLQFNSGANAYLYGDGTGILTPGAITATGGFVGNASTATALAADPSMCGAGMYVTDIGASGTLSCSTPTGTYTLPAASTTLGGVKQAAGCSAGNHVSSIGAGGELTCTADAGGSGAPTTAQYWVGAADAGLSAEKDLSALATGLVINTTGTPSIKGSNSCTNQFPRSDNASGTWTCASIATADLPAIDISKGGTTQTASTEDAVLVGSSTTAWQAKVLPSCSNATTSKLLYDTSTNSFSCGTDQSGGGGGTRTTVAANWSNATTSYTTVLTNASLSASTRYMIDCKIINRSSVATVGVRYRFTANGTMTSMLIEVQEPSAAGTMLWQHHTALSTAGTQAANLTTNNLTTISGIFTTNTATNLVLEGAAETTGTVYVDAGSTCLVASF